MSFPIAAALIGALVALRPRTVDGKGGTVGRFLSEYGWLLLSMLAGLLVIFLIGTMQLYAVMMHDWAAAFQSGFLIFSGWDLLKLGAAVAITRELRR